MAKYKVEMFAQDGNIFFSHYSHFCIKMIFFFSFHIGEINKHMSKTKKPNIPLQEGRLMGNFVSSPDYEGSTKQNT